ncbi:MAG: hypothetical protein JNK72_03390 [Myxococcales bacterium]|nr:hypothetical protein [Myxococcales bacterium]
MRRSILSYAGRCLALLSATPSTASALDCFEAFNNPTELAQTPTGRASSNVPVTLATTFRVRAECSYGLSATSLRAVPAGDYDFATLSLLLARGAPPATPPRTVFARRNPPPPAAPVAGQPPPGPSATQAPIESIFREECTESLLRNAFRMQVSTPTRMLSVARVGDASPCAQQLLELRFVPEAQGAALSDQATPHILPAGAASTQLNLASPFVVYAARATAPGAPRAAAMRLATVATGDPLTPLRRALLAPLTTPWFAGVWGDDGALHLERTAGLADDPWAEFATAAQAGQLWITAVDEAHPERPARVIDRVRFAQDAHTVALPGDLAARTLQGRYGRTAAPAMSATFGEWQGALRRLQVCIPPQYSATPSASLPESTPPSSRCARLSNVLAGVGLPDAVAARIPRQLCAHRQRWQLDGVGHRRTEALDDVCLALPRGPRPDTERDAPEQIVSVGDRLSLDSEDDGSLYACIDNTCRALVFDAAHTGLTVWKPGLIEIRRARSLDAALSAEGLTLLRMVAVDPRTDWLPVGLAVDGHQAATRFDTPYRAPEGVEASPWVDLPVEETSVFGYIRRVQTPRFAFISSPSASAAWNAPDHHEVLTSALPVIGSTREEGPSNPPHSALAVLLTRARQCPTEPAGVVRSRIPVDPDALAVDQTFTAFLVRDRGNDLPFECLAEADFRVRPRRVAMPRRWLRLGLLGDVQWAFFLYTPFATGVAVPVGYADARIGYGFSAQAALSATVGVTFDDAAVTRAGAGLSLAMSWGPEVAPRLVSVGAMLHLATGTRDDEPWVSPYLGINLSTLVELVGGR